MTGEGHGLAQQLSARLELSDGLKRVLLQASDQRLDLAGGHLGPPGQTSDLIGDHGETATLLACPGRFDRRIERQQVGLSGHRLDHVEHHANAQTLLLQRLYGLCAEVHFSR
ncbi:hypothetical protein D3C71_1565680 [compost metagenome]